MSLAEDPPPPFLKFLKYQKGGFSKGKLCAILKGGSPSLAITTYALLLDVAGSWYVDVASQSIGRFVLEVNALDRPEPMASLIH